MRSSPVFNFGGRAGGASQTVSGHQCRPRWPIWPTRWAKYAKYIIAKLKWQRALAEGAYGYDIVSANMVVSAIRCCPIGISDNCRRRSAGGGQGGFLDLLKSDNSDKFYLLFGFVKFFDGNFEKELVC